MINPVISIIIPTYNRAHLINETLESILIQTYKNWECIIVDDGSTDNTAEIVSQYIEKDERFQYHQRPQEKIKGPNSCRNYGFEKSKGLWINWFDSDDSYNETALETFVENLEPEINVAVGKLVKIDSVTKEIIGYNRIFSENLIEKYFTGFLSFYVCGPLWSRDFLNNQEELFDENIRYLDDWDFNLRMLYQKPKIKFIDKILFKYNINLNSLSNQIYSLNSVEINSEITAREKQLKIIKKNKSLDYLACLKYVRERYKIILRDILTSNEKHIDKKKLFFMILKKDMQTKNPLFYKIILGYFSFLIFKKGYFFFK
ncbi:glycosyltransferase family 2 protein [Flavobacterium ginsenosidimutans]|uniref:Glycosyltransferase n=1 Tax=Flavobacterium ginsenosidimutans TaxID=687844 RepID=A0ABZ2QBY1_9FLAO|nr:glycosyltransferase [Flavobacterium ginsenosidimutans]KAF2334177.1 glycosyltransferase family 2 protein [Flavobacterium ginsenosidimutans]